MKDFSLSHPQTQRWSSFTNPSSFTYLCWWDWFEGLHRACRTDRSAHAACWRSNKWGVMGRWWNSGYCFNLLDASRWQRLITRWHRAVMLRSVTSRRAEGERWLCVCAEARWFSAAASPSSVQGVIESGAVISVDEVARRLTNGERANPSVPSSTSGWVVASHIFLGGL